jgi:type IX secretion system PorP/SprF family membrane protein
MKKLICMILFFVFALPSLEAQQVHFSQFYNAPLHLNPALTGNNECIIRVGGNYRDQWRTVSRPYQTYTFFADARIQPYKFKKNWFGLGLQFYGDKAGTSKMGTNDIRLTFAYHKGLLYKNKLVLSAGFSLGYVNRTINTSGLYFGNQWTGAGFDMSTPNDEPFKKATASYFDINAGILVTGIISDYVNIHAGASMDHLTTPGFSFMGSNNRIGRRTLIHAGLNAIVTPTTTLMPKVFYSTQDKTREVVFGFNVSYRPRLDPVYLGLWYRWKSDLIPVLGIGIKNFNLFLSYDINVSRFTVASKAQGGFEIALLTNFLCKSKTFNTKHKTKARGKIKNCPIF